MDEASYSVGGSACATGSTDLGGVLAAELVLGIDIGIAALRVAAVDADGVVRGTASAAYETQSTEPGWAEQRPDDWWQACRTAVLAVGAEVSLAGIVAVRLTGQMHGTVFLDSEREVIRPALLATDERAAAEATEVERTVGLARFVRITGNRPSAAMTAAKLLWLRHNQTIGYKRLHHVLAPKDYVRLMLTGELGTDANDASRTGLFDVGARAWSTEIIDALDLDESTLPRVYEGREVTGHVLVDVAAALKLPPSVSIVAEFGER